MVKINEFEYNGRRYEIFNHGDKYCLNVHAYYLVMHDENGRHTGYGGIKDITAEGAESYFTKIGVIGK